MRGKERDGEQMLWSEIARTSARLVSTREMMPILGILNFDATTQFLDHGADASTFGKSPMRHTAHRYHGTVRAQHRRVSFAGCHAERRETN